MPKTLTVQLFISSPYLCQFQVSVIKITENRAHANQNIESVIRRIL